MSRKIGVRTALFAVLAVFSLSALAQTTSPSTGLGQSWPNATDVSQSPNFHVYVFRLNGVKYIQVNDLNGVVHAAIGVISGAPFALPIGLDAQNVTTGTASSISTASSTVTTVYSDADTIVTTAPASATTDAPASSSSSSGTSSSTQNLQVEALSTCPDLFHCSGVN